jgi:hypothetical protein
MRYDYMREISHLREQMFQKEIRNKDVEYIDVRFFEPTADIDPKIQAIINEKLSAMAVRYNSQIHRL